MSHGGSVRRHAFVVEQTMEGGTSPKIKRLSSWDVTFLCIRVIGTLHTIGLVGIVVFVAITTSDSTDLSERLAEICLPPVCVHSLLHAHLA